MITMIMGSAVYLAAMQAAVNVPRAAFADCLKKADAQALASKVGAEAYMDFVKGQCANESSKFKNALIGFDVKNGVKRQTAASDADLQIDDYLQGSIEHYKTVVERTGSGGS
jgi:hypothetical protein